MFNKICTFINLKEIKKIRKLKNKKKMRNGSSRLMRENLPAVRTPSNLRLRGISAMGKRPQMTNGLFEKCDRLNTPASARVKIIRTPSAMSTKKEINGYIQKKIRQAEEDIAASTIQQFWRDQKTRKKNRKFVDPHVIIKFPMTKEELLVYFQHWKDFSDDSRIKKRVPRAEKAIDMRENFGPLFWTFQVLKRLAVSNNHPKFLLAVCDEYYIPEWNFFVSKNKKKNRMIQSSDRIRRKSILRKCVAALHNYAIVRKSRNIPQSEIDKQINLYRMRKVMQALKIQKVCSIFNNKKLRRLSFAWYTYIDKVKMLRAAYDIHTQRKGLKQIKYAMDLWKSNGFYQGVNDSKVVENITQNKLKLLPFAYLLRGDFYHYTFSMSFLLWNRRLSKLHACHSFISFVLNESKKRTLKRFLFDCFRYYGTGKIVTGRYMPFIVESVPTPSPKPIKKSTIFKYTALDTNLNLDVYKSNSTDVYQNLECKAHPYQLIDNLPGSAIRTIFYHLAILVSVTKGMKKKEITQKDKQDKLKEWKEKKGIDSLIDLINLKRQQNLYVENEVKALQKRIRRDTLITATHEAHDAALEVSKILPKFNPIAEVKFDPFKTLKTKEVTQEELNSVIVVTIKLPPEEPPFLKPIDELADMFRDSQRQYRRKPRDAFSNYEKHRQKMVARARIEKSASSNSQHTTGVYEAYQPVIPSLEQLEKLNSRKFLFSEFRLIMEQRKEQELSPKEVIRKTPIKKRHNSIKPMNPPPSFTSTPNLPCLETSSPLFITSGATSSESDLPKTERVSMVLIMTEYSAIGLGYTNITEEKTPIRDISYLTRRCIVVFDLLIKKKVPKKRTIDACLTRIVKFITAGRSIDIPKLEDREPLFREEVLNRLIESDSYSNTIPNFVDDLLLCIGQMSSLLSVATNDYDDKEPMFPFTKLQKYAREIVSKTKPTLKRVHSLANEIDEQKPTDFDARFFGFVAMFFISSSMLHKLMST